MFKKNDLLAPNDPGKLYSAIERKAAGWAVMDAESCLSINSAGTSKGANGEGRGSIQCVNTLHLQRRRPFAKGGACA